MVMSTPTLAKASRLMTEVLVDRVQLYTGGEPVTVGIHVTRENVEPVGEPIPALVQTTVLQNAAESQTSNLYSVKVAQGTVLEAGMIIGVESCVQEPSLVGKKLLLDKVSENGLALLRKAVASDWDIVNQEGKEDL